MQPDREALGFLYIEEENRRRDVEDRVLIAHNAGQACPELERELAIRTRAVRTLGRLIADRGA